MRDTKAREGRFPSWFISHGTPMAVFADDPYTQALKREADRLPRPRAIVAVSAHGLSPDALIEVSTGERAELAHDFRGFPGQLYLTEYPCPGDPELSVRVASLLGQAGFQAALTRRPLDHGVWIPLLHAYPAANVPVVQISLPYPSAPREALRLGQALAPLRREGVLLMGSGGVVHNLQKLRWDQKDSPPADWARAFDAWVSEQLRMKNVEALVDWEALAPASGLAHPSAEHFHPLFFTLGASLPGDELHFIFEGFQYYSLSLRSFSLGAPGSGAGVESGPERTLQ